jgi:hypothetical protein
MPRAAAVIFIELEAEARNQAHYDLWLSSDSIRSNWFSKDVFDRAEREWRVSGKSNGNKAFPSRDPVRNDITLEVQAIGDLLGPWAAIATSTLGAPFTGPGCFGGDSATPGVKSVEVRDTVNVTDAPQRFLRVRVRH